MLQTRFLKIAHPIIFILFSIELSLSQEPENTPHGSNPPMALSALAEAYPNCFTLKKNNVLIWKDGTSMKYHGIERKPNTTFKEILNSASIEEQMQQIYPMGEKSYSAPAKNFDPGRIRNEAFFAQLYGNRKELEKTLRTIVWLPNITKQKLRVTTLFGVDKRLEAISAEIEKLPKNFHKYAYPSAGTYNWRVIAGTNRLSSHSYAMSIDLNIKYSNYWKWSKSLKYQNKIPQEIVEIFEKHGFIWGGKWYHYDTMHFEYRPELIILSKKIAKSKK